MGVELHNPKPEPQHLSEATIRFVILVLAIAAVMITLIICAAVAAPPGGLR